KVRTAPVSRTVPFSTLTSTLPASRRTSESSSSRTSRAISLSCMMSSSDCSGAGCAVDELTMRVTTGPRIQEAPQSDRLGSAGVRWRPGVILGGLSASDLVGERQNRHVARIAQRATGSFFELAEPVADGVLVHLQLFRGVTVGPRVLQPCTERLEQ